MEELKQATKVEPIGQFMTIEDLRERFNVDSTWIVVRNMKGRLKAYPTTKVGKHNAAQALNSGSTLITGFFNMSRRNALELARRKAS